MLIICVQIKSSLSFSYILQEELPKVNSTAATNINAQSQNSKLFTRTPDMAT